VIAKLVIKSETLLPFCPSMRAVLGSNWPCGDSRSLAAAGLESRWRASGVAGDGGCFGEVFLLTARRWCSVNVKGCAADVKQFRADTKPGEGRVEACIKAHFADLSDACKVGLANEAAGED